MIVVTRRHLLTAASEYPDAAKELSAWFAIASASFWRNMTEVAAVFKDMDVVDGYTIFNIRRNRYRLITVIHYSKDKDGRRTQGHIYIRSFLTHKQYDNRRNWDKEFGSQ
jgi:mRNA interferase HigB